jgi:hypothetical protein
MSFNDSNLVYVNFRIQLYFVFEFLLVNRKQEYGVII